MNFLDMYPEGQMNGYETAKDRNEVNRKEYNKIEHSFKELVKNT